MGELKIPTPHINAKLGDFAKTVLMPGDPLRSQFIAENFLENPVLVNNIRDVHGYTGTYKGKKVSVMATGMGMPAMGIYSYELFQGYDVENIIRVGSIGAIREDIQVMDLIMGMTASYDSYYAEQYNLPGVLSAACDYKLLRIAEDVAVENGFRHHIGNILSSDKFYDDDKTANDKWAKMGICGLEMEAASLYMNATRFRKRALCICTVSDHILRGEAMEADKRRTSFRNMIITALETAIRIED